MSSFAARRRWGVLLLAALCLLFWGVHSVLEVAVRPTRLFSGWVLFVLVIALTIFNLRKKLPFLPLGTAVAWMELHAYAGLFAIFVFLAHVGFRVPEGPLEVTLALLFVLVSGSGVVGLALSRWLPIRLSTRGEAILFERIPALRLGLHDEVEELVLGAASEV